MCKIPSQRLSSVVEQSPCSNTKFAALGLDRIEQDEYIEKDKTDEKANDEILLPQL